MCSFSVSVSLGLVSVLVWLLRVVLRFVACIVLWLVYVALLCMRLCLCFAFLFDNYVMLLFMVFVFLVSVCLLYVLFKFLVYVFVHVYD